MRPASARQAVAEGVGTAMLLAAVVGSGIMGERLSGGNVAVALLANALATGAALVALILTFGPVSGAHFNPVLTLVAGVERTLPWRAVPARLAAQVAGAFAGVALADVMFGEPVFAASRHAREGLGQLVSEAVATFGLVGTIHVCSRRRPSVTSFAVAAYIVAAYWFTASTSFANPAATLARSATDTFAGIRPGDVGGFIGAQFVGAFVAAGLFRWLVPSEVSMAAVDADADVRPQGGRVIPPTRERPIRVLFLCTANSCRSQMAEGLARHLGKGLVESYSAGTNPKGVHPLAVKVLAEIGVDISKQRSQSLDEYRTQRFDYVITVCDRAKESCPVWPDVREQIHWSFDDPAEALGSDEHRSAVFRRVLGEMKQRLDLFLLSHLRPSVSSASMG